MVDYGDTPGPGAYCAKIDLTTFQAPVYSMAGKLKRGGDGVKPGPGQYDPRLGPGGPSYSLRDRTNDPKNKNPGPGAYDPYVHEQLPDFSLGKRLDGRSRGKNPGPGEYDPQLGPGGPSYSLKSRLNPFKNKNPGPGTYCANFSLTTFQSPVYSMGARLERASGGEKPGPGQYDPHLGPGGPSFSMHERTNDPRNKNPGPGAYDPYVHEQLPNFSLGKRLDGGRGSKSPGPGQYDPKLGPGGPSCSMYDKLNPFKNKNPGPGAYDPYAHEQLPNFSLGKRLSGMSKDKIPGPGQYNPHLGPGGPNFSMYERTHRFKNKNPGPGAYDPYAHECLPNFSLGQRLDGMTGDQKPGPGAYDTDNPHTGDAPAFTMGFRIQRKRPPNRNMKQLK